MMGRVLASVVIVLAGAVVVTIIEQALGVETIGASTRRRVAGRVLLMANGTAVAVLVLWTIGRLG